MAKDLTTRVYESLQPECQALILIVVTIVFTIFSSFILLLCLYVRVSLGRFSS